MQMYKNYISPLGYQMGDNRIDSYGVNHSGFNTHDDLYYNLARQKRENALIGQYNNQGITKNYPQYGTNFWGVSANNNYGFGNSNIENIVEPMLKNPLANPPLNNQSVQYAQNTFEKDTNLRISDQDAYNMAQNHMKNDLAHGRSEFTDFDYFPNPLKEVLLDIQYNTGGLNKQNWPKLYNAISNRDVKGIANNVHRKDVGWDRNNWAEQTARSIRF